MDKRASAITEAVIRLITEYRKQQNLTYEMLADRAGIHRTTIGLIERGERTPTLDVALRLAAALDVDLSVLLARAEAIAQGRESAGVRQLQRRLSKLEHFHNDKALSEQTGLHRSAVEQAINSCYETLDTIDFELVGHGSPPMARLVELANISSMVGNILGGGLAEASGGLYKRNKPHTYPDLLPVPPNNRNIEIKIALDTNSPKGHLPKRGTYLTFRYVLASKEGKFERGKANRGDTVFIWEARVGVLENDDFAISNTAGDSGKTAVIKTKSLEQMPVIYYVPSLLPYAKARAGHPSEPKLDI